MSLSIPSTRWTSALGFKVSTMCPDRTVNHVPGLYTPCGAANPGRRRLSGGAPAGKPAAGRIEGLAKLRARMAREPPKGRLNVRSLPLKQCSLIWPDDFSPLATHLELSTFSVAGFRILSAGLKQGPDYILARVARPSAGFDPRLTPISQTSDAPSPSPLPSPAHWLLRIDALAG